MSTIIQKQSARTQARELISEKIITGILEPNSRINETALARDLGVSQTPIREALLGLEGQGYIFSKADKGFFVRPLDVQEVKEIYPILGRLEAMAISTIDAISEESLTELEQLNDKFSQSRGEHSIELDDQWHRQLLNLCTNHYLIKVISIVRNDAHRYENMFFREGGNVENSASQHKKILSHLRKGKLSEASNELEKNCICTIDPICRWLEKRTA